MFKYRDFNLKAELPVNSGDLIQDLELKTILNAMAMNDEFVFSAAKTGLLTPLDNEPSILYRQDVLKDCIKNPGAVREIYQIPIDTAIKKRNRWLGILTHSPSGVLSNSVEMMDVFVEELRRLRQIAVSASANFTSEGFVNFFELIKKELDEEYLQTIEGHLKHLRFKQGVLISTTLGKGNEEENLVLRLPNIKKWIFNLLSRISTSSYSFRLAERDDAGARALGDIKNRGVRSAAIALAQAADHIDRYLITIQKELAFYIGCLNLMEALETTGNSYCFPTPKPLDSYSMDCEGLYDIGLGLLMKQKIIGNDLHANDRKIILITGANQGGKSTLLRSIGVSQLLMQSGMFVGANKFSANVCTGVFTHYRRKEDTTMKSGKLDDELAHMSQIIDSIKPRSLMLFNESFSATNEREGSIIAGQITDALISEQIKVVFVTHMFEFANSCIEKYKDEGYYLRAQRLSGGKRTFKLIEGQPLATSFGVDVYKTVFNVQDMPTSSSTELITKKQDLMPRKH